MRKLMSRMPVLTRMALYLAAASFFIWRSQSPAMFDSAFFFTGARAMCILLALFLVLAAVADTSRDSESAR